MTHTEQSVVRRAKVAVVGLGGTGGTAFECLVRLGCERFILFDHDRFELGNFNRQILATDETIDMKKTDAAVARAKSINKNVKINSYGEFRDNKNKIKGARIVIDGTDNVETRVEIARICRAYDIPYVFCSAGFAVGMVSVFTDYSFERAFQLPNKKSLSAYNTCRSVIAPVTMLAGTLAASQATNHLLKKEFVKAPDVLMFDLFGKEVVWKKRLE